MPSNYEEKMGPGYISSRDPKRSNKPKDFVPSKEWPKGHRKEGTRYRRCQKWSHSNAAQCLNAAMRGQECCGQHGGRTLRGLASPRSKTMKYSKYLPKRLVERYEGSSTDIHLLALREEIRICDVRISDLMEKADSGESGEAWKQLRFCVIDYVKAQRVGDPAFAIAKLETLKDLIDRGCNDYEAWREINDTIELRRRLTESERKREMDLKIYVSVEESLALARLLTQTVVEIVKDKTLVNRIRIRFADILDKSETPDTVVEEPPVFTPFGEYKKGFIGASDESDMVDAELITVEK